MGPTSTRPAMPTTLLSTTCARAGSAGDPGSSAPRADWKKLELHEKKNSAGGDRSLSGPEPLAPDLPGPPAVHKYCARELYLRGSPANDAELEAHRCIFSVSVERYTQHPVAAYADAGCRAAAAGVPVLKKSQRLKKTENTQKKPPKVHGQGLTISQRSQTFWGPRPEPDLLPEEHSESATRSPWLSGQRLTQVLLVRLREGRLQPCDILLDASGPRAQKRRSPSRTVNLVETEEVLGKGTESGTQDQEVPRGYLKASSWDGAGLGSGQKPQTKYKGRAFGLELGSAAADCFS